jgi:molybdopterin/thiamine biosynthesis adenylyltransferase
MSWTYEEAFSRNIGLLTEADQEKLRNSRIAIAGMGGVGGVHLMTLTRLGIGRFTIADPDTFDVANFNRQYGASLRTLGRNKAEVMAEEARAINPELDIRVFATAIDATNIDDFFQGVDIFLDGVDFFSIGARRLLFKTACQRGHWALTAGPIGFSAAWLLFDPQGMPFDDYFDLHDGQDHVDQLIALAVGLTPKATQRSYLDLSKVNVEARTGPSAGLACHLASGVAAAEILKILTQRGRLHPVPHYHQFDAFRGCFRQGRCPWGNRHWAQRFKRHWLKRLWQSRR